jgi:hypothetical protein
MSTPPTPAATPGTPAPAAPPATTPPATTPATAAAGPSTPTPTPEATPSATPTPGAAPAAPAGAPEKYALTVPEGEFIDQDDLTALETHARQQGWTNEVAQAALTEFGEQLRLQSERFLAASKADTEYGGEKLAKTQQLAQAVLEKFRPASHGRRAAFMSLISKSGIGNHIELLSLLADIGHAMAEDRPLKIDGGAAPTMRDPAKVFYGG